MARCGGTPSMPKARSTRISTFSSVVSSSADADTVVADLAEVQPLVPGGGKDAGLAYADLDGDRVEERLWAKPSPPPRSAPAPAGWSGNAPARQWHAGPSGHGTRRRSWPSRPAAPAPCRRWMWPFRAGYAARGFAAKAGRPCPPRASIETPTIRPGIARFILVAAGHEGRMRTAIAHRHAKALAGADGDIGAHRARFLEQAERRAGRSPRWPWPSPRGARQSGR